MSLAERANFLAARIAEIDAAMVGLDVRQLDELGGRVVVRLQCRLSSQNMLTKNPGLHTLRPQAVRRATGDGARPSRLWPDLVGWRAPSLRALRPSFTGRLAVGEFVFSCPSLPSTADGLCLW